MQDFQILFFVVHHAYSSPQSCKHWRGQQVLSGTLRLLLPEQSRTAALAVNRLSGRADLETRAVENRSSYYRRWGKRLFDVTVSAAALLLLAPLFIVLPLSVLLLLGKPILFRQVRTGRYRRAFTILKFRTMTNACNAEGKLRPDTERLTRFGNFLRATSVDELPELWNVLKGEMSLVGPRPLYPQYDAYYTERESMRFEVLPGITGWAQINGRNDLPWDARLECDAVYTETLGFWLDMRILTITLIKVLRRDNVHVDTAAEGNLDEERRNRMAKRAHTAQEHNALGGAG
jgi:sugar transferase EpsL